MSDHYQAAIKAYESGQTAQAIQSLSQYLETDPSNADAWHMLGIMYYQNTQTAQAVSAIAKATELNPNELNFLNNYGLVLKANNQLDLSINAYERALQLAPKDADVLLNVANVLMACDRFEEAAGYYRRLIHQRNHQHNRSEIQEALCHAIIQMGNRAHQEGKYAQAEACFAEAVTLKPNAGFLYYNLANAERELGQADRAAIHYAKAIKLNPNDADSHNNLGNVQRELGQLEAAMTSYQTALAINPTLHHALVHLVHQQQQACDWNQLDSRIKQVKTLSADHPTAQISPFAFLSMPSSSAHDQLQCANHWVNNRFSHLQSLALAHRFDLQVIPKKKLKIGYLSADFRLHPLAFLITDLVESHDRSAFEVNAYAFGPIDQSDTRKRLVKAFDHFHEIQTLSELEAAQKIYADEIDILIDLTGFTQTSRSGIMVFRPASIHISWLGFPGTMGYLDASKKTPLYDYLLTDTTVTPPSEGSHYAETLRYLPCYQPNDRQRPIGDVPSKAACDLPADAFVFCCFNQSFKITPDIFASWMRILALTPGSVLWLLETHPLTRQNLLNAAKKANIDTSRLIFAPRIAIDEHLARHVHADLFLDTPVYNAHTTCSDALWMDVPVLTRIGATFASRVAASLVSAVGIPELIVTTEAEYEQTAIALAQDSDRLLTIKNKLKSQKTDSILFDTPRFTKALEAVYQDLYHQLLSDD